MTPSILKNLGTIHWVLDWDGTITKKDTLNTIVDIAASYKPHSRILDEWKHLSQAYMEDYERTLQGHVDTDPQKRTTIASEKRILAVIEAVERRSLNRVSESKIFAELTREVLEKGAARAIENGDVKMRDGFADFFRYIRSRKQEGDENQDVFHILSVNWSRRFIASILQATDIATSQTLLPLIHSNELEGMHGNAPSSGVICAVDSVSPPSLISSRGKLSAFEALRQRGADIPTVYIGDSWTDLECLLTADVGICIRDEPMTSTQQALSDSLGRAGMRCLHLGETGMVNRGHVFWAKDFEEIRMWLKRADLEGRE